MATKVRHEGRLYDADFFLWTRKQAAALRAGRLDALDLEIVAEEIESLGRSDRRELRSRLGMLAMHRLKWRYQPDQRGGSWECAIRTQRSEIQQLLDDSPSLRRELSQLLRDGYDTARHNAAAETKLPLDDFPLTCPFEVDQVLAEEWWP